MAYLTLNRLAPSIIFVILVTGCTSSANKDSQVSSGATPSATPIPPEPTSLEELTINSTPVAYWAWKKSSLKILNSTSTAKVAFVEIGPNTAPDYLTPQVAIDLTSRLYSDHKQSQDLSYIYYEYEDTAWAQKKLNAFLGVNIQDWQKKQAQNSCMSKQDCRGAVAITHSEKPAGIVLVTASADGKNDVNHTSGTLEAHEYAHIIQDELQGRYLGQVPRWQAEGEAMFAQAAAIHHLDFSEYNLERQRIIKGLISNREISQSWLVDFISPASGLIKWQAWDKYDSWRVYDVGMLVTEILTSLKGPESTMRLSAEVGKGVSYQMAFEKIYGLTWKSAVPMLAKIIYSEINS
jgi:hypothetical protein